MILFGLVGLYHYSQQVNAIGLYIDGLVQDNDVTLKNVNKTDQ